MAESLIGRVSNYLDKISVAVIALSAPLKLGDEITIRRGEKELRQVVESLQIDRESLQSAKKGDVVAILVDEPVTRGAQVFKN